MITCFLFCYSGDGKLLTFSPSDVFVDELNSTEMFAWWAESCSFRKRFINAFRSLAVVQFPAEKYSFHWLHHVECQFMNEICDCSSHQVWRNTTCIQATHEASQRFLTACRKLFLNFKKVQNFSYTQIFFGNEENMWKTFCWILCLWLVLCRFQWGFPGVFN